MAMTDWDDKQKKNKNKKTFENHRGGNCPPGAATDCAQEQDTLISR